MAELPDLESDALSPLRTFYAQADLAPPVIATLGGEQMPQPYRGLLAHDDDMTPTLERFHGGRIHLRVLHSRSPVTGGAAPVTGGTAPATGGRRYGATLMREVVLLLDADETPAEFGAIRIHLDGLPENARRQIHEGRRPLGAILAAHGVPHVNRPSAFLRVTPDPVIIEAMGLVGPDHLYGRCNTIRHASGEPLAEVVEILPPMEAKTFGGFNGH